MRAYDTGLSSWHGLYTAAALERLCMYAIHRAMAAHATDLLRRYHNVLFPITQYVCELIPDAQRDSTRVELYYEGAPPADPNELWDCGARIGLSRCKGILALLPSIRQVPMDKHNPCKGEVRMVAATLNGCLRTCVPNAVAACLADLDKLQQEEVAHICEWLTEKVDSYSTRLNPEPKDEPEEVSHAACHCRHVLGLVEHHRSDLLDAYWQHRLWPRAIVLFLSAFCDTCSLNGPLCPTEQEEEAIGDVDLFTVSEDGKELTVNAKWLQHLQERLLGEDGHPRKARRLSSSRVEAGTSPTIRAHPI